MRWININIGYIETFEFGELPVERQGLISI